MDRRSIILLALAFAAACSSGDSNTDTAAARTADSTGAVASTPGSAGADASGVAVANNSGEVAASSAGTLPVNLTGRIPVLEYHVIGGDKNPLYTRTAASYRADLEDAYKRGYRPITIAQMLDKDFREVPPGMSPVVVVFDEASDSQFRYLEQNGKLTI